MTFLFMLFGAILGAILCSFPLFGGESGTGLLFGAITGLLLARIRKILNQLAILEGKVHRLTATPAFDVAKAADTPLKPQSAVVPDAPPVSVVPNPVEEVLVTPNIQASEPLATPIAAAAPIPTRDTPSLKTDVRPAQRWTPPPYEPNAMDKAVDYIKRWFTQGNVPVKIGVLVLFGGVAALLKYAADQGWFTFPIELRLAGIAAAALAALLFAWRKRQSHRAFALSLQGGAIGVLLLTVFAAFRLYQLLPTSAAFALLVILVAGTGVLAVLQDALALALLGIVGGFLAPVLISSGNGNHIALFSYYAVLNAAILGVAWIKPWRALNLAGFAFTFAIATVWGSLSYRPQLFNSTEPFLVLFFLFYVAIPILYSLRQAPQKRGLVDGTLTFGTPLLAFALQAALLQNDRMTLAFSALSAAALYTVLAWLLLRRLKLDVLGQSFAILAVGFATIAVPLALSARSTACTWALEGAGLVWLGLRQDRRMPRWTGYVLQFLAGMAYFINLESHHSADALPLLNGDLLGALLVALAGFASARLLLAHSKVAPPLANLLFVWALGWWLFAGAQEIHRFAPQDFKTDWLFGFAAFTAWLAAELRRRWDWEICAWPAAALIPFALPMIVLIGDNGHGSLEGFGAFAWALWLLAALRVLACLKLADLKQLPLLHFIFLWVIVLLLNAEFTHLSESHFALATIWVTLCGLAPFALAFWLTLLRSAPTRFPLDDQAEKHRPYLLASLALAMGAAALSGLFAEGNPTPLTYVPIVNPLELAQLFLLLLMLRWYRQTSDEGTATISAELRTRFLVLSGFVLLTSITLRSVHFFTGAPWSDALFDSPMAQASLSVVWSLTGIIAMVLGARRNSRGIWIGGALLMGVVIGKLILVDRHHLHDLPAILGTLAVGLLLLVVGYFAPVPPRQVAAKETAP